MSQKRIVNFNALPRETRERFVASAKGEGDPKPVFEDTSSLGASIVGNLFLIALGLGVLYWVAKASFGQSLDGYGYLILYGFGGFCALGGLLSLVRAIVANGRMPYAEGTYLMPVDLVQAEGPLLVLHPLSELSHVNGVHHHQDNSYTHTEIKLVFKDGTVEELTIHGKDEAEQVMNGLNNYRTIAAAAVATEQYELFQALDPFYEARNGDWDYYCAQQDPKVSDGGPAAKALPGLLGHSWLIGLALGVLVGGGIWKLRNDASDDAKFEAIKDSTDPYVLEWYLSDGFTRHEDEVRNVLLPRAYFEVAKAEHSVTALREFLQQHAGSPHEQEAREAIHALFAEALADFEREAEGANPNVLPLMKALFAWLEANDSPPVEVRFHPPDPTILEEVDEIVATMTLEESGGVPVAAVSPSFDTQRSRAREAWIASELEDGFRRVIPADILDLEIGDPLPLDLDLQADPPKDATIAVSYSVDASGSIYTNEDNTQGYVGIQVFFVVSMLVPGVDGAPGPEPLTFMLDVQPPSEFSVETSGIAIEPSDYLVYDVMAKKAFENLAGSLGAALFATGDAANLEVFSGEIPELPGLDLSDDGEPVPQ